MQYSKRKVQIIWLLLSFLSSSAIAQSGSKEYGNISLEEMELKKYDKDTTAAALILFDKAHLDVDHYSTKGWEQKRHVRIKFFKQSAIEEWSKATFYIQKKGLKKLRGATYNLENGQIKKTEMGEASIFVTKHDKSSEKVSFALPNVKVGSVIEFEYSEEKGRLYLPRWKFQSTIPTVWSEYSFYYGRSDIEPHFRGPFEIVREEIDLEGNFQKWVLKDVPAFKTEPLMPDKDAYLAAIEFTTKGSSWAGEYKNVNSYGGYDKIIHVEDHHFLKVKADSITAGVTEVREKVRLISDYIRNTVHWNGVQDFYAYTPRLTLDKKEGSSGDINLLLAAMLEKVDIDVNLVLLSTRDHGFVLEDFPWRWRFNYLICELTFGNERLLLDATEKYLPFDMLPIRCFNHKGFLMTEEQYGWIGIEPKKYNKISVEADLSLSETGDLAGDLKLLMGDYAAYQWRKKELDIENEKVAYVNSLLKNELWDLKYLTSQGVNEVGKPVIENYRLKISGNAVVADDLIYINPFLFLREEQNPFKLQERLYPVDFEMLEERTVLAKIKVPEGYKVEEVPQNAAFVLPGNAVKFISSISHSGQEIVLMSRIQVNKTLFQPFEYAELKEIYDKIIEKQSEVITLRRK